MRHTPVLLSEAIELLELKPGMNVIDGTLGDAGHAEKMLEAIAPDGMLLGMDADPEAIPRAKERLAPFQDRAKMVHGNFARMREITEREHFETVNAILFDLGWSSPQFAERGRGLSFEHSEEPLDMRYDPHDACNMQCAERTAAAIVQNESESFLENIFRIYGDEPLSKFIAHAIVEKRRKMPIERVGQLVAVILETYQKKLRSKKEVPWIGGLHPATRVFQSLRIAVNHEDEALSAGLRDAYRILEPGGRCAVISFHSLEDRMVKHAFKEQWRVITKKPITCGREEYERNPRARSAKLRVAEKRAL